jgi:hypothetical protein
LQPFERRNPPLVPYLAKLNYEDIWHMVPCLRSVLSFSSPPLVSVGKAPADVSATEGALDLPDYVAGIVKENWTAEVFDLELLKGPYAPSEEELMTALQLAMRCVTNPPSDRPEMDEVLRNLEELSPPAEVKDDGSTTSSK